MNTFEVVRKIAIQETGWDITNVDLNSNFNDLGINSIEFVKMIVLVEDALNIEFEDEYLDYGKYNSIDEWIKYVEQKVLDNELNTEKNKGENL